MSYRVVRQDEAGIWAFGPEQDLRKAIKDAKGIVDTRTSKAGEKWSRVGHLPEGVAAMWQNTKGDTIKVVE